jgi:hypothetical protein
MDNASMRDDDRLVTIAVFETIAEASIARALLRASAFGHSFPKKHSSVWGTSLIPTGSLQVLESDKDRAVAERRRSQIRRVRRDD